MSVFTSFITETIPVPGDPGQTVTIRKLAPKHLRAAMAKSQRDALLEFAELKRLGASDVVADIQALQKDTTGIAEARAADPLLLYDRTVLLQKGIIGWTYGQSHDDPEVLDDLDDEVSYHLARAILRLTKPGLFAGEDAGAKTAEMIATAVADAQEADRKND